MLDVDQLTAEFFTDTAASGLRQNATEGAEPDKLIGHYPALQQALQQQYVEKKHGRKTDWDKAFA
ncbi:MAG: hypothetical protein ACI9YR_003011, partial [Bacteroidia bacterium]